MPKYYLRETSLANIEMMMMLPPGFKSGEREIQTKSKPVVINRICKYFLKTEKEKQVCRNANNCDYFEGHAKCLMFSKLVECFAKEIGVKKLTERICCLLLPQTCNPFKDEAHFKRTVSIATVMTRETISCTAVVFLLSANQTLWKKSRLALYGNTIDFKKIDTSETSRDDYILIQTAKDLYYGGCRLTIDELCDHRLISNDLFRLIISAFIIQRYKLTIEML